MLANFTLKVLQQVVKEFNLVSSIKSPSKLKKNELIKELQKHVEFNWRDNTLTTKDRRFVFTLPESKKQAKLNESYKFFENEIKKNERKRN